MSAPGLALSNCEHLLFSSVPITMLFYHSCINARAGRAGRNVEAHRSLLIAVVVHSDPSTLESLNPCVPKGHIKSLLKGDGFSPNPRVREVLLNAGEHLTSTPIRMTPACD